jgi:hypothetical protein
MVPRKSHLRKALSIYFRSEAKQAEGVRFKVQGAKNKEQAIRRKEKGEQPLTDIVYPLSFDLGPCTLNLFFIGCGS